MNADVEAERKRSLKRMAKRGEPIPPMMEPEDSEQAAASAEMLERRYIDLAEPYVRELRREWFGSTEPPLEELGGKVTTFPKKARDACDKLAEATGFRKRDVRNWILTGKKPTLHPVMVHVREQPLIPEPDIKTDAMTKRVVIELNAPVTDAAVRRIIYHATSRFWGPGGDADAFIEGVRGPRRRRPSIRPIDNALAGLMERMPEDAYTWPERATEWSKDHEPKSADALRRQWRRLEEKRDRLLGEGGDE